MKIICEDPSTIPSLVAHFTQLGSYLRGEEKTCNSGACFDSP